MGVTLAGRRFGAATAGWIAGLPLTSGPVSAFLAVEQGPAFAEQAAPAMLVGMLAFVAFCVAMAWAGGRMHWPMTLALALAAYVAVAAAVSGWRPGLLPAAAVCTACILVAHTVLPRARAGGTPPAPPAWDIPVRAVLATGIVLGLTTLAPLLGAAGVGLLSPFPAFVAVIAGFTQHHEGPGALVRLLRGVLLGALSFVAFFAVVGVGLPELGLPLVYGVAALAACSCNAATLLAVRRPRAEDEA